MSERATGNRVTRSAAGLLALAALCLWASSRMTWVTVTSSDGLGEDRVTALDGGTWAAATTPLALVLIAAIAAVFAVRGLAVRVVGILVVGVAVVAAVPAIDLLVNGASDEKAAETAGFERVATQVSATDVAVAPALLVLAGAVLALAAAVMLLRKPTAATGLSAKYDSPAVRREAAAKRDPDSAAGQVQSQRMLWDALDAGDDPTVDDHPSSSDDDADHGSDPGATGTRPERD